MGGVGFLDSLVELNSDSGQMAKPKSSINHLLTRGLKDKCQDLASNLGCVWGGGVKIKIVLNCWPAEKVLNLGYRILSPLPQTSASSLCALADSAKGLFCKQVTRTYQVPEF